MAVFRKITDLRAGAAFPRFIRYTRRPFPVHMACPVPEKGVSGTEYHSRTRKACFLHRVPLKMRRVPQEGVFAPRAHIPYHRRPSPVPNARH